MKNTALNESENTKRRIKMKPIFQCRKPGQPCYKRFNKICVGCGWLMEISTEALDRLEKLLSDVPEKQFPNFFLRVA